MFSITHAQSKKLLIIYILKILRKYSDEEHKLSQKDILDLLKKEYGMNVERKAIKRNLMDLIECEFDIEYEAFPRKVKNDFGEESENYILTNFYINSEFTDSEIRFLINSTLYSKAIPQKQKQQLISKLENLSNKYFKSHVKYLNNTSNTIPTNQNVFLNIEIIDEAISKNLKISFNYNDYGLDKKLHPKKDDTGKDKVYIINPYQTVSNNGRHYLIGNYDKYDNISHYRLDRITNIKILKETAKSKTTIKNHNDIYDLSKYISKSIYMFSGNIINVSFTTKPDLINDILDWFGDDVTFKELQHDEISVTVKANEIAIKMWIMQYINHIKVTHPQELIESIKADLKSALNKYK
ncbi:helix-turn-helix transcriptional regulator [Peptoniphilus mikwangii]|uniref:helix-turn-helix transcriptional regulator n=1 Tax=Peptoniphilus mikwangii TaxID=1354300 RepID=UPI000413C50B|nr:WYL domain-containing protein [Peptoniphilus mikwangii]